MAKSYTDKYLLSLNNLNEKRTGVQFGKLCVKANLPPSMIADALGVSRMSVYNWFKGKVINQKNIEKVERCMEIIEFNLNTDKLPATNTFSARTFIIDNVINKI
jgi:flagella basal body P-ring formation protein FlgA